MDHHQFLIVAACVGMLRGAFSLILEHPLDTIKTYWQARPSRTAFKDICKELYSRKGWLGFYSGAVPNVLRVMIKQAYRYPLMVALPVIYSNIFNTLIVVSVATGLTVALLEGAIITPLERFKVWLMTFPRASGGISAFIDVARHHVVAVIYQGLGVTVVRQVVSWVTFLVVHDQSIYWAKQILGVDTPSLGWLLIISIIVGGINTAVVLPIDSIKTNVQRTSRKNAHKSLETMIYIYNVYGFRGLYVGWQIRWMQYMVHASFTVPILEQLKSSYGT